MTERIASQKSLILFLIVTIGIGSYLTHVLNTAEDKTALLPGETTHGHYQIEMECAACHTDEKRKNIFTSSGVPNSSCNACHADDLERFSDSHPVRKFKNPENAIFTRHIDALNCVTCHEEHNQKVTGEMAVTVPADYCAHCHNQMDPQPHHENLAFNSCATAGCHNYHDNIALAPTFLLKHYGEKDVLDEPAVQPLDALARWLAEGNKSRPALTLAKADAPVDHSKDATINGQWEHTAHAAAGINCSDCHGGTSGGEMWEAKPNHNSCRTCHEIEVDDFQKGKHGMRLAHSGLSPMRPELARQPMKNAASHESLSCSSCHQPHRYDRKFAAHEACIQCHDDTHTNNYTNSTHSHLWEAELKGEVPVGTGVSCATCHMPREERRGVEGGGVVNHDQSANLRPNEKMLRNVCMNCHGMQFALDSITDRDLIDANFTGRASERHPGIDWTVETAIKRGDQEIIDLKKRTESVSSTLLDGSNPSRTTKLEITTPKKKE